ncbi:MAG: response regulator transcription factor [Candidatus Muirbacterium halophilum]|nr:response regulator transcription factor [Candidatus Muirbacterium halophilum]MCK9475199.1 response regulator transcription factor [Candidatus Muirbacterium halophilum]
MKILLIEDEISTAEFIVDGLKKENFAVFHIPNGLDGLFEACNNYYDIFIIDVMLPDIDGITIIKKIREKNIQTPVIILSAKNSTEDIVSGLRAGSDDYISKPFSFIELLARIKGILRRMNLNFSTSTILSEGNLKIDCLKKKVFRDNKEIILQAKEFSLLEYLLKNKGIVVTKQMIIDNVWNFDFDPETNIVEAKISKLRNKIDKNFKNKLIHTIKGLGYILEDKF